MRRPVEIAYQDPRTRTYLGSPSIARAPDGALVVTHDYFGPGCPKNHEEEEHLSTVYRSEDDGLTWHYVTHIAGAFWSSLFTHKGALYLLGCSQQYGAIVIRRSEDGGYTWTHPADAKTGLLFSGGVRREPPNYHCAPVPVLRHKGRLYRAYEDCDPCEWGPGFRALVISADAHADLLDAASWRMSNKLAFDLEWLPTEWGRLERPGWLEGNVVADRDGQLWDVLRFNSAPRVDITAMVRVDQQGRQLSFDPERGFIRFPGGMTKFVIRYDPLSDRYVTLSNPNSQPDWPSQRNRLALCVSEDLRDWRVARYLLEDESGLSGEDSLRLTGFQYVDWIFEGEDILAVVRTAYAGAHNFHDSNRIWFLRVPEWRGMLDAS
ncbi:MAG: sialidase family protein [Anaerolineae bacterium]